MRRLTLGLVVALGLAGSAHAAPCCGPITPAGERLAQFLDDTGVDHLWQAGQRVNWETGEPIQVGKQTSTHCSAFAAAVAERLGVYILRPPQHPQDLLANAQMGWLRGDAGCTLQVAVTARSDRGAGGGQSRGARGRSIREPEPGAAGAYRDRAAEPAIRGDARTWRAAGDAGGRDQRIQYLDGARFLASPRRVGGGGLGRHSLFRARNRLVKDPLSAPVPGAVVRCSPGWYDPPRF